MLFSCKITNSAIHYLGSQGADLEELYQELAIPEEFLRDPSYWLEAEKMEAFLDKASKLGQGTNFREASDDDCFASFLGHSCYQLRSWGVLDSVLRMMQRSQDVFAQPDRFISYFVSPAPPIGSVDRTSPHAISFDIPISSEQYPRTSAYLRAALEAVPTYIGDRLAEVDWRANRMEISWEEDFQQGMFGEENDPGRVIKPELAKTLVQNLENSQKELEKKNQELLLKNIELEKARDHLEKQIEEQIQDFETSPKSEVGVVDLAQLADTVAKEIGGPISYLQEQVMRLSDYMGRSQQLVTLLVGQGRKDKQISEAMRRMDWEQIQENYPNLVQNSSDAIVRLKTMLMDLSLLVEPSQVKQEDLQTVDINQMVLKVLGLVKIPSLVNISSQMLLDRSLKVHPVRFEQAILNLVNYSLQSVGPEGLIKIRSIRVENTAVLEIFNSSLKQSEEELLKDFSPFSEGKFSAVNGLGLPIAKSIVERHSGQLIVLTNYEGTKFVIQMPC